MNVPLKKLLLKPELGVFIALILLITIFSLISPYFLTGLTWGGIITSATEIGIIALGATILMSAGEFDLSVGSNFAFSGMVFALATVNYEWSPIIGLALALGVGASIGFLNALITIGLGIPSFIATLGSMLLWRGVVLVISDGFPISVIVQDGLGKFLTYELVLGFKSSAFIWLLIASMCAYMLKHHPWGNSILATGGNKNASFAMGVPTKKVKYFSFVFIGLLAGLAGVIQFEHLGSLSPTAGEQYELNAIAIAVIGGTLLTGGVGSIWGCLWGTLVMGVLASGLVQSGVSTYWFRSFVGLILVLAVVFNQKLRLKLQERVTS